MMYYTDLQPLRIPGGWTVVFNNFEDIDFEELSSEDDKRWLYANEDLLYITAESSRKQNKQTQTQKLGIDLGWYPDSEPTGSFMLQAVLNDNWTEPLMKFTSRSKTEIVDTLERWLFKVFMPPNNFIDEKTFRKYYRCEQPTE